jgi:predicted peroxiredoxin
VSSLLYVLTHSTEDPDRAATALAAAIAARRAGHDVALWLSGEGARLGVAGVAETLNEPLPESATAMIEALVAAGAVLYVDRVSFDRRQYAEDALRPGAVLEDAAKLAELVAGGRSAVTL